MSYTDEIKVGSTVFVGEPAPLTQKVTWRVSRIDRADLEHVYATLHSGMTGRTMTVPLERLRIFRVTEAAA